MNFIKFSPVLPFLRDRFPIAMGAMMSNLNNGSETDSEAGVGKAEMPAEFGLAMATFVVVASMVGTGILTTSGYTVATVGSNEWMLILWVVGGLTAVCGALTLAELSAALPRTGGDYVYLYEAYGPLPAFLSGWVSFLIGFAAPGAASAFASAKYLLTPWQGELGIDRIFLQRAVASFLILAFAAIHVAGRKQTSHVQGWITAVKLVLLGGFAAAGLSAGWPNRANLTDLQPITNWEALAGLLTSLVYIYYGYTGWNAASFLAGEVRDAQRLLPRAILLGTGGVLALYMAVNVVYAMALTPSDIRGIIKAEGGRFDAVAPIAELAAGRLFGPGWARPLSIAFGLMLLSSLSAYLLVGPRVLYAMAQARQFPAVAARLTSSAGTPGIATAFQLATTLALLWVGSVESIILYAGIGLSIFSMLAMSSIFVLRRRRPDLPRPFRTPGYPVTPALYLALTGTMTVAAFSQRPAVSCYALLSILAGVPFYYLWRGASGPKPAVDSPGE
jgi:APA family basic amino acid/polyamine antiporter